MAVMDADATGLWKYWARSNIIQTCAWFQIISVWNTYLRSD